MDPQSNLEFGVAKYVVLVIETIYSINIGRDTQPCRSCPKCYWYLLAFHYVLSYSNQTQSNHALKSKVHLLPVEFLLFEKSVAFFTLKSKIYLLSCLGEVLPLTLSCFFICNCMSYWLSHLYPYNLHRLFNCHENCLDVTRLIL